MRTRREFLLGTWLAAAKAMGRTEEEKRLCERNARTQITYWGPDSPAAAGRDYAFKEWSGFLQDFYLARWQMFIDDLDARLHGNPGRDIDFFQFEKHWTEERNDFPVEPSGDPINAASTALGMPAQIPSDPDRR